MSWGKCDYRQLKELQKRLEQLQKNERKAFIEAVSKELAGRLLAKVIKRTPVGQYPAETGKVGGTLRRGWTAGKEQSAVKYAKSLPVYKNGDTYTIVVKNPIEYASYVEFGHRTRDGGGWVEGRFMLTKSEMELEGQMPKIIEKKLQAELEKIFKQ